MIFFLYGVSSAAAETTSEAQGGSSDPARRYLSVDEIERLRKAYARARGLDLTRDDKQPSKPKRPVIEAVRAVIDVDAVVDSVIDREFSALKIETQQAPINADQFDLQAEIRALEAHIAEQQKQTEDEALILLMMAA